MVRRSRLVKTSKIKHVRLHRLLSRFHGLSPDAVKKEWNKLTPNEKTDVIMAIPALAAVGIFAPPFVLGGLGVAAGTSLGGMSVIEYIEKHRHKK